LTHTSAYGHTTEAAYRYDGLGRRISKTVRHTNGTTANTHYGWDGDRIVREESDSQRSTIVYEPGSFVPLLRIDETQQGQALSAFVTDAIGTPMQLVAANGDIQWQGQPDDWAAVKNVRGSASQPIRFQGQWHDEESGLYYNRHRYYDPQQGRYISQDPIGLRGGTNLYGYVSNPTGMVDPLGLEVVGTFDVSTGDLVLIDSNTGIETRGVFQSGGKPFGKPIPDGEYDILEHPDPDFFRLESRDSNYGDDIHEESGRDLFRLHRPGMTIGCIAATDASNWLTVREAVLSTATDSVTVNSKSRNPFGPRKEQLRRYGRITVMGND
ncbi:RHS repeat-associated core domain-containing protein, partial [Halomonas sp.]|uniref:RHS repeat-associated core domain-containing protein n=1 Tax=Halomonas sp. TaxID=1486246 RepID=UPI003F8E746F